MIPVFQTILGPERGNCFAACLASILEVPLETVPGHDGCDTGRDEEWRAIYTDFLNGLGFGWFDARLNPDDPVELKGFLLGVVRFPGSPSTHAVVLKDGEIVHDPIPGSPAIKQGLPVQVVTVIYPLDPARLREAA